MFGKHALPKTFLLVALVGGLVACGSSSDNGAGGRGNPGGTGGGGVSANGGTAGAGGISSAGGSSGSGGSVGGTTNTGGIAGSPKGGNGGGGTTGGSGGAGGSAGGAGGASGGTSGAAGSTTDGGADAGSMDAGVDAGAGDFNPCPSNGDPCRILPLGDSITLGTNFGGGYRIKLFAHAVADEKNITFVGYDTANPPSASTLSKLGSASSKFVNNHEGHFAWTIQQVDDLITGVATSSQDGVNYTGKKIVADAKPHIVLVHIGTNDMQRGATGATDRLGKFIDHIVADAPNALVVVGNIIPLPQYASAVTTYNQAIPGIVKQRADAGKHVVFVDQFAGFSGKSGLMDQVHPYEAGYEQMAIVWYERIKSYLR
jgi:hypothetical protein